jgi:predicted nucleotidyltransferase
MSKKGLISSLFSRTKTLVLKELVLSADTPVHLRELARRTGLDASGIQRELRKLTESGIVLVQSIGNQKGYTLNRRCPIHGELRMILLKTAGLADELNRALHPLVSGIRKAYVYGSVASGEDTSESDVDLMVIGDVSLRDVVRVVSKPGRKLGRVINPIVMRPAEYRKRMAEADSFVRQVEAGPKIMLMGDPDES